MNKKKFYFGSFETTMVWCEIAQTFSAAKCHLEIKVSAENQKGINAVYRWSVESQKGASAVDFVQ